MGIPYVEAINLPLHIALAFLGNMRPSSPQVPNKEPEVPPQTSAKTHAKTYVSTVRKHSKKSQD
ncbi:hypothetical protein [Acinetobacter pittii]|uniref:hypothetical protein n=1 Tax=Acinetobacter pittii TaxID=48296 RepID=UPI0025AFE402|nr:hypothetical protein [Acinetobacter pittii]